MTTPPWLDFALMLVQIIATGVLLAVLATLTWASRTFVRASSSQRHPTQPTLHGAELRTLWATLAVLLVTTLLLETHHPAVTLPDVAGHGAETALPHAWEFATATGADRAYAVLLLAGYVCLAQILIAVVVLTRRHSQLATARRIGPIRAGPADHGAALVATFALLVAVIAVAPTGAVSYLHLQAHLHTGTT